MTGIAVPVSSNMNASPQVKPGGGISTAVRFSLSDLERAAMVTSTERADSGSARRTPKARRDGIAVGSATTAVATPGDEHAGCPVVGLKPRASDVSIAMSKSARRPEKDSLRVCV